MQILDHASLYIIIILTSQQPRPPIISPPTRTKVPTHPTHPPLLIIPLRRHIPLHDRRKIIRAWSHTPAEIEHERPGVRGPKHPRALDEHRVHGRALARAGPEDGPAGVRARAPAVLVSRVSTRRRAGRTGHYCRASDVPDRHERVPRRACADVGAPTSARADRVRRLDLPRIGEGEHRRQGRGACGGIVRG
jgi:hypothetical protein